MKDPYFFVDCETTNPYPIEIRRLFSATLTTAYHDLFVKDGKANKDARKWFSSWKPGLPRRISFYDCCEYLMLTKEHREFFEALAK